MIYIKVNKYIALLGTGLVAVLLVITINLKSKNEQASEELDKANQVESKLIRDILDRQGLLEEKEQELSKLKNEVEADKSKIKNLEKEIQRLKTQASNHSTSAKAKPQSQPSKGNLLGTFEATAYTDDVASQGKWVGKTASGMKPQAGVIAVDPNIIPLGTKLYVEGYGNCIAGDTGGAIKGYRIDLFKNTSQECYNWGRRSVKVYKRN